ncbi:MAG: hypothetical protein LAP38_22225 [Acidobacteriia bacterium]|nr:hypothetical protein [Terriglobia bacterium]
MILPRAAICFLLGFLVSCSTETNRPISIGEAYVGPSTLKLHQDLSAKSAVSGTVKHGDKLEILEYRRRLARVRGPDGATGWTDMRQLLTPEQMASLRHMADSAAQYPSQGAATVYDALNMHTEPNRSSPSFWQIPENGKVDVIGHKLVPRFQPVEEPARPAPPKPAPAPRRKDRNKAATKIAPPPPPPAPKPPADWLALSVPKAETPKPASPEAPAAEPKPVAPVPMDDWSLVRTADNRTGWVLTRMLIMSIPDDVAQYAEGHRITSYFALRQTKEDDSVKNDWLWTTITKGQGPYEFDSFRVFVWSHRHRRYETAYIERNVAGHFPVEVDRTGSVPRFSLILESDDGHLFRKTYTFEGFRIRMVSKEPYVAPPQVEPPKPAASLPQPSASTTRSLYSRLKDRVRRLFRR